ncbi:MAG: LuxR family transcriptional regulator [Phycisphaerae bacterium SM23_33]|nr:MAG: LuxR family transcriptional regulator [Phycisphaerae bacterium SM23_33]
MKPADRKKVLIVDDHPVIRYGITQTVEQEPDMLVCGQAEDVQGALEAVERLEPDVAVVDISLKHSSGIELIKQLRQRRPGLPVLVLSMHDESLYAERALRAGARGYVTKAEPPERIVEGIRQILQGGVYVSDALGRRMLRVMVGGKPGSEVFLVDRLSDREFEIFELIGQGLPTREIAQRLQLSIKTVETHRERIKDKLKLDSAADLLKYAIRWGQFVRGG